MASNCWNVHQHVQLWQSLFSGGQNQFGPFLLWENRTKFVNGEKICINSWKVHQLVGMLHNSNRKMTSTIGTCINCWNGDLKVPQHLEGASNVGMWHQHLEGASNVGFGLETDLRGFKF